MNKSHKLETHPRPFLDRCLYHLACVIGYPDSILTKFFLHFTFYSPHPSKNAPQIHVNSHSIVHYILQPPLCKLDFWTSLHISIHALALSALSSSRVSPNLLLNHLWNHHFIQKTYKHCLYSTYPITVYLPIKIAVYNFPNHHPDFLWRSRWSPWLYPIHIIASHHYPPIISPHKIPIQTKLQII